MGNKRGLSEAKGRVPQRPLNLALRRAVGAADQGKRSNQPPSFGLGLASGATKSSLRHGPASGTTKLE